MTPWITRVNAASKNYPTQNIWFQMFSKTGIETYSHLWFRKAKFSGNLNNKINSTLSSCRCFWMFGNNLLTHTSTKLYFSKKLKPKMENLPVMPKPILIYKQYLNIDSITIILFFKISDIWISYPLLMQVLLCKSNMMFFKIFQKQEF